VDRRVDEELAQLDARDPGEHRDRRLDAREDLVDAAREAAELRTQQRLVGRLDAVAEDVLDDLVALVHAVFDQRIAGEGADDVDAGDRGLVLLGELRHCAGVGRGEMDAHRFEELPRRNRAETPMMRSHATRASPPRVWSTDVIGLDRLHLRVRVMVDLAALDRAFHERPVCAAWRAGTRRAVDDPTSFCSASARAFSMPASPTPTTRTCLSECSAGSSS
jgi:hypothetical protein